MDETQNPTPPADPTPKPASKAGKAKPTARKKPAARKAAPKAEAKQPEATAPANPPAEPKADTITESMAYDPSLEDFYHFHHADPGKQYFIFSPESERNGRHGSQPITRHSLFTMFYRPEKIEMEDGKILALVFDPGHPEHPEGFTQFIPDKRIVMSRDIVHKVRAREKQFTKDNPGYVDNAGKDVNMVMGPNGAMVLDRKAAFIPGSKEVGDMLPSREQILRNNERINAAREDMPEEFYDALNREAEAALAR